MKKHTYIVGERYQLSNTFGAPEVWEIELVEPYSVVGSTPILRHDENGELRRSKRFYAFNHYQEFADCGTPTLSKVCL